jgi:hypothetical protein
MTAARRWLLVSVGIFVLAMPMNSFCVHDNCDFWPSYSVLMFGWLGVLGAPNSSDITWLANPLIFAAWLFIFLAKRWLAIATSALAVILGASFLWAKTVLMSEGGNFYQISGYATGYWLWLASMALACLAAVLVPRSRGSGR